MGRAALPAVVLALALGVPAGATGGDGPDRYPLPRTSHFDVLAGYGGPLGPTAGVELLIGPGAEVWTESEGFRGLAGFRLQLHGGPRGGKLGLGMGLQADIESEDFSSPVALGVQTAVVVTSRDGGDYATYMGPELDLSVWRIQASVGVLHRVHSAHSERVLFNWGLGVRF